MNRLVNCTTVPGLCYSFYQEMALCSLFIIAHSDLLFLPIFPLSQYLLHRKIGSCVFKFFPDHFRHAVYGKCKFFDLQLGNEEKKDVLF